eukprot:gnl/MRDRNA2_/MRDRNA2_79237_c0_seq1.p1 gnl/MRDRNA2_/MRDRNA2_79237_c0~~gnl/MRDRNA2_/MRDRNA2_79237_c0_seq1.p1  ORF type:complete len:1590 (-),score=324.83 gnl/MRDRNA2_/MRDRNA2_79237_c0_seq1:309-5030(-)
MAARWPSALELEAKGIPLARQFAFHELNRHAVRSGSLAQKRIAPPAPRGFKSALAQVGEQTRPDSESATGVKRRKCYKPLDQRKFFQFKENELPAKCMQISSLKHWGRVSDRYLPESICGQGTNHWLKFDKRSGYYYPYWYLTKKWGGTKIWMDNSAPFLQSSSVRLRGCCEYDGKGWVPLVTDENPENNIHVERCATEQEKKILEQDNFLAEISGGWKKNMSYSKRREAAKGRLDSMDKQCQVVDLAISATNLKKMDLFSESDPVVTVYVTKATESGVESRKMNIGRTEVQVDMPSPVFKTMIPVEYSEADRIIVTLVVEDVNADEVTFMDATYIGEISFSLNQYTNHFRNSTLDENFSGRVLLEHLIGETKKENVGRIRVMFNNHRPCPEQSPNEEMICYDEKGLIDDWTGDIDDGHVRPTCNRIVDLPKWMGSFHRYINTPICGDMNTRVWMNKMEAGQNYIAVLNGRTGERHPQDLSLHTKSSEWLMRHDAISLRGCCHKVAGVWQPVSRGSGALHVTKCSEKIEFSTKSGERLGMVLDYTDSTRNAAGKLVTPVRIAEMSVGTVGWNAGVRAKDYLDAFELGSASVIVKQYGERRWQSLSDGQVMKTDVEGALEYLPASYKIDHMVVPRNNRIITVTKTDPTRRLGIVPAQKTKILSTKKVWLVSKVYPETPAWEAQVRYGDEIIELNHDVSKVSSQSEMRRLMDQPFLTAKIKMMSDQADLAQKHAGSEEFIVTGEDGLTAMGLSLDIAGSVRGGVFRKPLHVLSICKTARDEVRKSEIRTGDIILELNRRPIETMSEEEFNLMWDSVRPLHILFTRNHQMTTAQGILRVFRVNEAEAKSFYELLSEANDKGKKQDAAVISTRPPKLMYASKRLMKLFEDAIALDVRIKDTFEKIAREDLVHALAGERRPDDPVVTALKNRKGQEGSEVDNLDGVDINLDEVQMSFSAFASKLSQEEQECDEETKAKVGQANMDGGLSGSPGIMANFDQLSDEAKEEELLSALDKAETSTKEVAGDDHGIDSLLELEVDHLKNSAKMAMQSLDWDGFAQRLLSARKAACQKRRNKEAGGLKKAISMARKGKSDLDNNLTEAVEAAHKKQLPGPLAERERWPTLGNRGMALQASLFHVGIEEVVDFRNWEIGVFHFRGVQIGMSAVGFGAGGYSGFEWKGYKLDWDLQAAYQTAQWESTSISLPGGFAGLSHTLAIDANNSAGNLRLWKPDIHGAIGTTFGYSFGLSAYSGAVGFDIGQTLYNLVVTECFDDFSAFIKAIWRPWCGSCKKGSGLGYVDAMKAFIHAGSWPLVTEILYTVLAFINKKKHEESRPRCSPLSTKHLNEPQKLMLGIDLRLQESAGRLEMFRKLLRSLEMAVQQMGSDAGGVEDPEIGKQYEGLSTEGVWHLIELTGKHEISEENPQNGTAETHTVYTADVIDGLGMTLETWDNVHAENIRNPQLMTGEQISSMIGTVRSTTCLREPMVTAKRDGKGCMQDDECPSEQVCYNNRCICQEGLCNVPGSENNNFGTCRALREDISEGGKEELSDSLNIMRNWVSSMETVVGNLAMTLTDHQKPN